MLSIHSERARTLKNKLNAQLQRSLNQAAAHQQDTGAQMSPMTAGLLQAALNLDI